MYLILKLILVIKAISVLPHVIIFYIHPQKKMIMNEFKVWVNVILDSNTYTLRNLFWLFIFLPEFRSVFYHRIGNISVFLKFFAKSRQVLQFDTPSQKIESGLVIQHGFSTIINAKKIGENVQIWHNVTIGTNKSHTGNKPIILDNAKICAGAIVIGNIIIGKNTTIGAGAVVTKNVPDNCVVAGNPAYIIKKDGERVSIKL